MKKFSEAVQEVMEDEETACEQAEGGEEEGDDLPPSMQLYAGEGVSRSLRVP